MTDLVVGVVDVFVLRHGPGGLSALVLRRAEGTRCTGAWEIVHGRVEPDERPEDAAVREVKGRLDDKEAVRKALMKANFESVRGSLKFNTNQFPIQNYYLRVITRDAKGRLVNKRLGEPILKMHGDAYVQDCKMK